MLTKMLHSDQITNPDTTQEADIQVMLDELTKDKCGIIVSPPILDFGVIDLSRTSSGDAAFTVGVSADGVSVDLVTAGLWNKAYGPPSP